MAALLRKEDPREEAEAKARAFPKICDFFGAERHTFPAAVSSRVSYFFRRNFTAASRSSRFPANDEEGTLPAWTERREEKGEDTRNASS